MDDLANAHLVRGNGDLAIEYLYSAINHGTPLVTWCEERGQEPGTEEEIKSFCETNFNVQFPLFGKVHANGPDRHPLYASLIQAGPEATPKDGGQLRERLGAKNLLPPGKTDITWNFEKFLVDRKGNVVGRFDPDVTPDDPKLTKAIEAALAA